MTVIKGYYKRQDPKWPFVVTGLVIILAVIIVLLNYNPPKKTEETASIPASSTTVFSTTSSTVIVTSTTIKPTATPGKKVMASNVKAGEIEKIEISQEEGRVYCRLQVNFAEVPQTIHCVWIDPDGAEYADIPLTVSRRPAETWSYISNYAGQTGNWSVQIKSADGKILTSQEFMVED